MTRRDPNYIDVHVGSRIRMRRQLISMSQEKLGELLGITFQQVQKYEKGSNRISASRLFYAAKILGVPVQAFFEDLPGTEGDAGFSESGQPYLAMEYIAGTQLLDSCDERLLGIRERLRLFVQVMEAVLRSLDARDRNA